MSHLKSVWNFIGSKKYWIVIILGILIVGVLDENSVLQHIRNTFEINDLQDRINAYDQQHEKDERQLRELRENPSAIKKIAREKYFMKADNEDIFVLREEQKAPQPESAD